VLQRDFVAAKVAPFKKIRRVEFLEAVPKSSSGKILRRRLKTAYSSMSVLAM
jgi:acyl-coenzyme A synthetase/AMP-(fatty) acid ligase